jgi:MFS family permease
MKFIVISKMLFLFASVINLAQLPIQLNKMGLSVGVVVATFTLFQCIFLAIGTWVSAWLARRVNGYRNVVMVSLGMFVCSQFLYPIGDYCKSVSIFFLAQSFHGIACALFYPLSNTLMEQTFTEGSERKRRSFFQSLIRSAENIGSVAGVSLATSPLGLFSWGIGIGTSLLVCLLLSIDKFPKLEVTSRKLSWRELKDVASLKAIYPAFFLATVQGALLVSGSLYLIATGENPVFLIIGQWLGIASMSLIGYLTQKKGNRFAIFVCLICLMLGLIGLIYSPHLGHFSYLGFMITGILLGTSTSGGWICFLNIAQESADKEKPTEGYAHFTLLWRLGILTGQLFSPYLGYLKSWYSALGVVVLLFTFVFFSRSKIS